MRKHTKITVSLLLVVCMLLSILPGHAFVAAAEADVTAPENLTSEAQPAPNEAVATVVEEDTSLRGEYEKHFLMSDGSYQAALYNEPVHKLEAGKWVEIDNTLALRTAADGTAQYKTANGLADVSFSQSFGDRLVTLRQDDYSVSWGVQAFSDKLSANASAGLVRPVQAEVDTSELSALSAEEQKTLASKASSTLRYRNALRQNVDLEYVVLPSRVKENIILQSPQDISYYVVTLYTENLSARLLENREIEFYNDSEEVIFTMTSPYMYDSAGELSEDIAVEMVSRGEGCYFIQMTPDAQWLNDESRVYPVVIDPQVSADTTRTNIVDNYVLEGEDVQNRNLDRLYIGNKSGKKTRAYIKYATMPQLPGGSVVTSATLSLKLTSGTDTAANASACQVTQDWDSATIKWDNRPNANTLIGTNISHNNLTGYNISCGATVKSWYVGTSTGDNENYGIMVCYYDQTINDYNAVYSGDCDTQSNRPALTINYDPPTGEVSVQEGTACTLTPPNVSGTITWSSSNTSIATVNSSGKVTGLKAGRTYVSATVNGIVQKTYTVYVTIADGVYYIKNAASNYYMSVKNGGISSGTRIVQASKTTSAANGLHQLWKIKYLGSGKYSFRPMHKLNLGIDCTSASSVAVKNIGTTEDTISDVDSYARWSIYWVTDGYVFKSGERIGYALCTDSSTNGDYIELESYTGGNEFRWSVDIVTGITNQVLLLDSQTGALVNNITRYVELDETVSLSAMGITPSFVSAYSIDQTIDWSTDKPSVVSVNSKTGAVTGLTAGETATITAKHTHNGVGYTKKYTVHVVIPNGTYSLRSRVYNRYLQVDDLDASDNYSTPGATVEQWPYSNSDYQKWTLTLRDNGYYSIISKESGLALSVPSGKTGSYNVSLVQEVYHGYDRQLWKITPTDDKVGYKIKAKSAESASEDLVMSVAGDDAMSSNSDGVHIEQDTYGEDPNGGDEWFICSNVDIGFSTDNYTTSSVHKSLGSYYYATQFCTTLFAPSDEGPVSIIHHYNRDSTHTASKNDFSEDGAISDNIDFMIYMGHGYSAIDEKGNYIHYNYSDTGVPHGNDCSDESYNVYSQEVTFGSDTSDLRWIWMYTCNFLTPNDYVTNNSLRKRMTGAHILLGYESQSYLCNLMTTIFADYLRSGETIINSFFKAGHEGESPVAHDNHIQKALCIPQAKNETIYSPKVHYQYDAGDVLIFTNAIDQEYND